MLVGCLAVPPIVVALFLVAVLFMFSLDMLGSDFAEHASTLAAPMLILVSFCHQRILCQRIMSCHS
jgi:hypothetical protein